MFKTVKDLGMPFYEKNFENGNLYLNFNIVFPTTLDTTQREVISKVFVNQTPKAIKEDIKEIYQAVDFNVNDENTHHMGGKKESN